MASYLTKKQADREAEEQAQRETEEQLIKDIDGLENQQKSAREYSDKLNEQIAELQRDKELYSEKEFNAYYDEKARAQSDTVNKIYELQGEINSRNERLKNLKK